MADDVPINPFNLIQPPELATEPEWNWSISNGRTTPSGEISSICDHFWIMGPNSSGLDQLPELHSGRPLRRNRGSNQGPTRSFDGQIHFHWFHWLVADCLLFPVTHFRWMMTNGWMGLSTRPMSHGSDWIPSGWNPSMLGWLMSALIESEWNSLVFKSDKSRSTQPMKNEQQSAMFQP